jgi:hypothetical protein
LLSGLALGGGGVGLFDPASALIDAIAYDLLTTTTHPFMEGTQTPNIPTAKSASRIPDGADTNVNSADFDVPALRTPGAPNAL